MRNRLPPTTDLRQALWLHSLCAHCIHAARNSINARDGYRAVKKHWFEISIVVFRAPLRATSANNIAAFAGCNLTQPYEARPPRREMSPRGRSCKCGLRACEPNISDHLMSRNINQLRLVQPI
jgi:hypothetical protein